MRRLLASAVPQHRSCVQLRALLLQCSIIASQPSTALAQQARHTSSSTSSHHGHGHESDATHHRSHHAAPAASHHKKPSPTSCPKEAGAPRPNISIINKRGDEVEVHAVGTFAEIPSLPTWLGASLEKLGYPKTTDIQAVTIPKLLDGNDIIGLAPTGSGKTVAFAVPALINFRRSEQGNPQILVLAPTRELVQQTCTVFSNLGGRDVRVAEAYGGTPREVQARRLNSGCDVLVACPGRLNDFLQSGAVDLSELSFLVFDEADRLLDMGFKPQLDQIMSYVDPSADRTTMMWSATWPQEVQQLAAEYLKEDRLLIRAGTCGTGQQVNENIKQHVFFASSPNEKVDKLIALIQDGTIQEETCKMIVFVERQSDTEMVSSLLVRKLGVQSRMIAPIHGGMQQNQRDYIMKAFKDSQVRILVATDVASRGLDFPDVTCVVNFTSPKAISDYCHRIGRTGRAGRKGDAFTFVEPGAPILHDLVAYLQKCGAAVSEELLEAARYSPRGYGRSGGFRRGGRGGGFGGGRGGGGGRFGGGGGYGGGGGFGGGGGGGRFGGGGGFGGGGNRHGGGGDEWA